MSDAAERLLEQALALPEEARAVLRAEIEESLASPLESSDTVEAAWRDEIAHRLQQIDDGEVELLDGETVLAGLRAKYRAHE